MKPETLILAVPGTQETQELSRAAALEAIRKGEIAPDHWVWSPLHNDWKQVQELPELQRASLPLPTFVPQPVAVAARQPKAVRVVAQPAENRLPGTKYSQSMEIKREFPIFKLLFGIGFLALAGIIAGNYLEVDKPFADNLATTSFKFVQTYAHLGGFTQPDALIIHVIPTKDLNADNFPDFLAILAKNTPPQPFSGKSFGTVGLTASWQCQYVMSGSDWQKLGQMMDASADEKKKYVLEHLEQMNGAPLVAHHKTENSGFTKREEQAWQTFIGNFEPR